MISGEAQKLTNDASDYAEAREFARALRAWRSHRGLTQDDLVELSGVSKSSISMAERAGSKIPPKMVTIKKLATALGLTVAELMKLPADEADARRAISAFISNTSGRLTTRIPALESSADLLDYIDLPSKWVRGVSDNYGKLSCVMVSNQTMYPTIQAGDVAVLEPAGSIEPGIYLVASVSDDHPLGIRRLAPLPNGGISVTCDNERFSGSNCVLATSEIKILAKVAFVTRCHTPE